MPRYDVSSLRSVVQPPHPCAPEVKRRMIEWWGPIIHEYYSGTEGLGMTWISSEEALTHPGSVGRAIWGEVHVCDDEGEEVPAGEDGVVYFGRAAGNVTFEYNHDPEKTKQTFNDKGWATLWDVGHLDEEGYLYLTDRKLFMIVSGGVNIYPQEIEDVLVLHPSVADVAVFGIPEPEMGEEVKAVVQPAPGIVPGPELEAEIMAFCRDHLSHYKCPHSVDFTDALPRGENGKLYKKVLREAYWASSAPSSDLSLRRGSRTSAYQARPSATTAPKSRTSVMPTAVDHRADEQVADAHGAAEAHDPQRHDPARARFRAGATGGSCSAR